MCHSGGDIDNEGGCACMRAGDVGNLCTFYLIYCESKIALKNKLFKKKKSLEENDRSVPGSLFTIL